MTPKYTQADMGAAVETAVMSARKAEYNEMMAYADRLTNKGIPPVGILMGITLKKHRKQADSD